MRRLSAVIILMFSFIFLAGQADASEGGQLLIINKKTNSLAYYNGGQLVKTFKVATGRSRSYTPEGKFRIVSMIKNRPYYKDNIPGGHPRNPLGDRWMGLEARGTYGTTYAIHGNSNASSIGTYASSGCIRMYNDEVRWLFSQVNMYTMVIITYSDNSFDAIAKTNGYGDGWLKVDGKNYYYVNGQMKKGWQSIEGSWYFFDKKGAMKTGWVADGDKKFYLEKTGAMKKGWLADGGKKYFFDNAGVMRTGWVPDGGNWYYLDETGNMKTGWISTGGKKYYLNPDGTVQTGWLADGGNWYHLDNTGAKETGWVNTGGKWYYLGDHGAMQSSIASNLYYLDSSGTLVTDQLNLSGAGYLLMGNESMVPSWLKYEDNWYYLYVNSETIQHL